MKPHTFSVTFKSGDFTGKSAPNQSTWIYVRHILWVLKWVTGNPTKKILHNPKKGCFLKNITFQNSPGSDGDYLRLACIMTRTPFSCSKASPIALDATQRYSVGKKPLTTHFIAVK